MFGGIPGDRYGRRNSLRITAVCMCSPHWDAPSRSLVLIPFARFMGGLAIGASSVLGPMYIAEIAPAKQRGRLVGFFQFNIVFGIPAGIFFQLPHRDHGIWRPGMALELGIAAAPAVLFLVLLFAIPESPRWLAKRGRVQEAEQVLRSTGDQNYQEDLRQILTSVG